MKPRTGFRHLPIANVYPNPEQPRKHFDEAKLAELAESIREHGLQQPIKVRPDDKGEFMIVCGERRYRAHRLLGVATIPAMVEVMTDDELADRAIIENLQRADISPLEEARAFQARLDTGITAEYLAKRLGLKQAWRVTERTNLLRLDSDYQDAFGRGLINPSQAQEMSRLTRPFQRLLFEAIQRGRCKSYQETRAVVAHLLNAEKRAGDDPFAAQRDDQADLFGSFDEPSPEERAVVTRMEAQIDKVVDLLRGGFKDNEPVIAAKVSAGKAGDMADKLELIEKHLAKLRIALRAAATITTTRAA